MSGRGLVVALQRRNEPKTNQGAILILTDFAAPIGPDGLQKNAVWISDRGPAPAIGGAIEWGPHHVWWAGERVRKLGNECDPNDPALWMG